MPSRHESTPSLPAGHALQLFEVARGLGAGFEQLFAGTGLSVEALTEPGAHVSLATFQELVARAISLTGQPALGILMGLRMRVPSHGFMGFAAMTAPTVRQALDVAVRYAPTQSSVLRLAFEEGEPASLRIEECCDLGPARETILFAVMVGVWRIGEKLTGARLVGSGEFAFPRPAGLPPWVVSPTGGTIEFDMPQNCLRFPASYLDLPLLTAEPSASRLAQAQCESALRTLGPAGIVDRVRSALSTGAGRTVDEVAATLGMSTRTLHRKLRAEGARLSDVADAVWRERACELLNDSDLSVEQVAQRMGYADSSNFVRAFRRWTGATPAAFRKRLA